jgi:GntR family transcriptional regulator, rspAB operon transcriptional repressor
VSPKKQLQRTTQTQLAKDRAYQEIKERILAGEFASGVMTSEREIAARLNISSTPIRAALERLEMDGLVNVSPRRGVVVREITLQEVYDHFEFRLLIEPQIVRAIAGRLRPDQLKELNRNLKEQERCVERRDMSLSTKLDAQFHLLLCEFHGNTEILRVMWQLQDKIHRMVLGVHVKHPDRIVTNYPEHRAIAEAVINGVGDKAETGMREHLEHGMRFLTSPRG